MNIVKLLTWMRGHSKANDIEKKQVELALISALKMSPEIDLSGAKLNSEDIKNLSRVVTDYKISVTHLNLSHGLDFKDKSIPQELTQFLQNIPTLKSLNLSGCLFSNTEMDRVFEALEKICLTSLDLSETYSLTSGLCAYLDKAPQLKSLNLRNNKGDIASFVKLVDVLANHPSLASLNLEENDIDDASLMTFITQLIACQNINLRCLTLPRNALNDEGVAALVHYLKINLQLTHLKVSLQKVIYPERLTQAIEVHPGLVSIALTDWFQSKDYGCVQTLLRKNPRLQYFGLLSCAVTSKNAADLIEAVPLNSRLTELDFYNNYIQEEGFTEFLDALVKNKTLEHINLGINTLNDERALRLINVFAQSSLLSIGMNFFSLNQSAIWDIASIISRISNRSLNVSKFQFPCDYLFHPEHKLMLIEALQSQQIRVQPPSAILMGEVKQERHESSVELDKDFKEPSFRNMAHKKLAG